MIWNCSVLAVSAGLFFFLLGRDGGALALQVPSSRYLSTSRPQKTPNLYSKTKHAAVDAATETGTKGHKRSLTAAAETWVSFQTVNDISYFLFASRIERFEATSRQWMEAISLPANLGDATAFGVDTENIFVSYNNVAFRYDLDGGSQTHMINLSDPIKAFHSDGNSIFINHSTSSYLKFTSISRATNTVIDTTDGWSPNTFDGSSISALHNRIFGRYGDYLAYQDYNDDGTFGANGYGSSSSGGHTRRTWLYPDENKVVDENGKVHTTKGLRIVNSFPTSIKDIAWTQNEIPIVLDDTNKLTAYAASLLPTGSSELRYAPVNIRVSPPHVLTFTADSNATPQGIRVDEINLDSLEPTTPKQPLEARGLRYKPDQVFVDRDGIIHLFSDIHQSIFRWDPSQQDYLTTIPLLDVPLFLTYSKEEHLIYIAYDFGQINKIDMNENSWEEVPFTTLERTPKALSTAGSYLFAASSGYDQYHYTVSPNGTVVSAKEVRHEIGNSDPVWSDANQRMYYISAWNKLAYEEINADGTTYSDLSPGGLGQTFSNSLDESPPIRVKSDGSIVVSGSGSIYNATSLDRMAMSLANEVKDIAFVDDGNIVTVRHIAGLVQFQEWVVPTFFRGNVVQVPGWSISDPTRAYLLALDGGRFVGIVLPDNDLPSFYVMNEKLEFEMPDELDSPVGLDVGVMAAGVNLTWFDVSGDDGFVVERRPSGVGNSWTAVGNTSISSTSFLDIDVVPFETYEYRIKAVHGNISSPYSEVISITFGPPERPKNVTAEAVPGNSVLISWSDVVGENFYELERQRSGYSSWDSVETLGRDETSYKDTSWYLEPGHTYSYRVSAVNGRGRSLATVVTVTTPQTPPEIPTFYSSSLSQSGWNQPVWVDWYDADRADYYVLERSLDGATWSMIANVTSSYFSDEDIIPGFTYFYRVKSVNIAGESGWSTVQSYNTEPGTPPAIPTLYSPYHNSWDQSVYVSWDGVSDADNYVLERSPDNVTWNMIANVTSSSFYDDDFIRGETYYYRVKAVNAVGESEWSEVQSFTTLTPTPPNIPSLYTPSQSNWDQPVYVDWEWVSLADYYVLERSLIDGANWTMIANATDSVYYDDDISPGVTYFYRVKAVNNISGESGWSEVRSVTTWALPLDSPELNAGPSASGTIVKLQWSGIASRNDFYHVERAVGASQSSEVEDGSWIKLAKVQGGITSFADFDVVQNTWYGYRVLAADDDDPKSGWSNEVFILFGKNETLPAPELNAKLVLGSIVELEWNDIAPSGDVYEITGTAKESSTASVRSAWHSIATLPAGITRFADLNVDPLMEYSYRIAVRSHDWGLISPVSNTVTLQPISSVPQCNPKMRRQLRSPATLT